MITLLALEIKLGNTKVTQDETQNEFLQAKQLICVQLDFCALSYEEEENVWR